MTFADVGAAIFGAVVFLHEFGVLPGPTLLIYLLGAIPMSFLFQMGSVVVPPTAFR